MPRLADGVLHLVANFHDEVVAALLEQLVSDRSLILEACSDSHASKQFLEQSGDGCGTVADAIRAVRVHFFCQMVASASQIGS